MSTLIARLLTLGVIAGAANATTSESNDYAAILEDAVESIAWDFGKEWAYTETDIDGETVFVGRFDPRLPEGRRWTLLSVDGRAPTEDEADDYIEDQSDDNSDDGDEITAMVEPGSLELTEETDEHWLLSFVPVDDDDDSEDITRQLHGTVRIVKDGPYLAYIDIRNDKAIKPAFGVKISKLVTRLTFGPAIDGGPIVPNSVHVRFRARAFLFIRINEIVTVAYSNFKYAGD